MADKTPLQQLSEHGQSVWIDYLSRHLLDSGELARMMREDAVVGVTSNPTIFQKAVSQGSDYDDQLRELLDRISEPKEIYLELTRQDVTEACDLLRGRARTGTAPGRSTRTSPTTATPRTRRRSGCTSSRTGRTSS